jgi:hypothetical protein
VGSKNRDIFGLRKDNEQKSLDFQSPPVAMALAMDLPQSRGERYEVYLLRTASYPRPGGTKCIYFVPLAPLRSLPFQGSKSLDFQGSPLPMAFVMDTRRYI